MKLIRKAIFLSVFTIVVLLICSLVLPLDQFQTTASGFLVALPICAIGLKNML